MPSRTNRSQLVGIGRVVSPIVGDDPRPARANDRRRAAGPRPSASSCPAVAPITKPRPRSSASAQNLVSRSLKAEHRVEDVERDEGHAVSGVGSGRDLQRGYGARLGGCPPEHLPVPGFAVSSGPGPSRPARSAGPGRIDAHFLEERVQAESASLVGHDRTILAPICGSLMRFRSRRPKAIVVLTAISDPEATRRLLPDAAQAAAWASATRWGTKPTSARAPFQQVPDLFRVGARV